LRALRGPKEVLPEWRAALPRRWNLLVTIWLYISLAYTAAVLFVGVGVSAYPVHFALMLPSLAMMLAVYWAIGVRLWNSVRKLIVEKGRPS
jgi:hypothetical protein